MSVPLSRLECLPPEVLLVIIGNLSPNGLDLRKSGFVHTRPFPTAVSTLARANKRLYEACVPFIFSVIACFTEKKLALIETGFSERPDLARHVRCVKLAVARLSFVHQITICRAFRVYLLGAGWESYSRKEGYALALIDVPVLRSTLGLITGLTRLHFLSIGWLNEGSWLPQGQMRSYARTVASIPSLTSLHFTFDLDADLYVKQRRPSVALMISCADTLEELSVE